MEKVFIEIIKKQKILTEDEKNNILQNEKLYYKIYLLGILHGSDL